MRNLKIQYCKQFATSLPRPKFLLLHPHANDSNSHQIYIATDNKLYSYDTASENLNELAMVPGIIGCEYLALDNEICVATALGEVLLVNPQTKAMNEGTFCDVGIDRMAWSPDQEVVVFVTKTDCVVVMTCTYETLAEHPLADRDFGEGQFISLGWSKNETQIHGAEVRQDPKPMITIIPPKPVEPPSRDFRITWRSDGAFFAVSYEDKEVGRTFKVFDKEGKLKYSSEKVAKLEPPLAWRPSGTWLAMPHREYEFKSRIILFEKNGLRHREIELPFLLTVEKIQSLTWSYDSDILSVETRNEKDGVSNLYMYTIGNYHWYLKQVLCFKMSDPIAVLSWDSKIGEEKTMHVLLESGKYLVYRWHFFIDKHDASGVVAVIDGRKLLITDFSKAVVPPPMCSVEIKIPAYINVCGLISNEKEELLLFIYDVAYNVHIFQKCDSIPLSFDRVSTLRADDHLQSFALGNMTWYNESYLIASETSSNTSEVYLISTKRCAETYMMASSLQLSGTVNFVARGSAQLDQFYVQTNDRRIHQISIKSDNSLKMETIYAQLGQGCADRLEWFSSRNFENISLILLCTNRCLFIGSERIAGDVTSFYLTGNYLAFTKLTTLYFLRLNDLRIVSERKIERGGKLVTIIANDSRTVLQMPRGNLETISPRVLALEIIGSLLERNKYNAAMDMLRKHRINLNIICDHNVQKFVENLPAFLQEIQNPNWLNLFLSDLQNEDLTKTMYASNYKEGAQLYPEGFKIEQKVFYLCEKLCQLMEMNFESRFRLPIITAYVKIKKLEKALDIIWQEEKRSRYCTDSGNSEESLKYLLYLVDVNQLYKVALGTYDFGLVLFVAQKSQKDPKEFLPFLNELKSLELNYRKFKIDEYLKRYEKALDSIAKCEPDKFNVALEFVKRHVMYRRALISYQGQKECYQQICLAFADHLRAAGKLEEASIMYERGNNMAQALLSAKHVLDWQRVLVLAQHDGQHLESIALSMVPSLQENGQYTNAFKLLKKYGSNFEEAIKCLLTGKLFLVAIFEAKMFGMDGDQNLIDSLVTPELLLYKTVVESNLSVDQEIFVSYKHRLLEIREKKTKQAQIEGENCEDNFDVDECDLLSDTTSMHSSRYSSSSKGSTGKTCRSSKNRRKHERKLLSLKPGNPFEDIALIDALYNHIMRIVSQQQHIRDTCKALTELNQDEAASAIQQRFKHLVEYIENSLDEIWIPEMMTTQQFLTGPNIDYNQLKNEQRYAMISPQKRFKPQLTIIDWELQILR